MIAPKPNGFDPLLAQLIVLGVVGAVESYLRRLFRQIISIDQEAQNAVYERVIPYGAAVRLPIELLPEALFEGIPMDRGL